MSWQDDIDVQYQNFIAKNDEASSKKAKAALQDCFGPLLDDMKENKFATKGIT